MSQEKAKKDEFPDHYAALGVSLTATPEEIKMTACL